MRYTCVAFFDTPAATEVAYRKLANATLNRKRFLGLLLRRHTYDSHEHRSCKLINLTTSNGTVLNCVTFEVNAEQPPKPFRNRHLTWYLVCRSGNRATVNTVQNEGINALLKRSIKLEKLFPATKWPLVPRAKARAAVA